MSDQARVLPDLSQGDNNPILAELRRLRAENEALRNAKATARGVSCKVTEKGGVSVYGLGRFPVTLYAGQWDRLLAHAADIKAFVDENRHKLSFKE